MRHIISILVENESGALSRIAGLFSARGYNIDSLNVAPTQDATMSRMTIVTYCSEDVFEQITKQLNKLIDVIKLTDLSNSLHVERELMLIKISAYKRERREEIMRLVEIYKARVIDVTESSFTIELVGKGSKLDAFINIVGAEYVIELVRSGAMGVSRGEKALQL